MITLMLILDIVDPNVTHTRSFIKDHPATV